jgi:phosphatidate cytidylyltransferase
MGRIVTGLILSLCWLLLLFVGTYPLFCLIVTAGGGVALHEFLRMSSPETEQKFIPIALMLGFFPLGAASLWGIGALTSSLFLALLILIIVTVAVYPSLGNGLHFVSRLLFGVFYVGFCSAHLILLYSLPQGIYWLLFLTAITVSSDTGAYYVGRTLGKTKLYPSLSPGKTRAGAVGIIGDLIESLIKRVSGVKDSGQILPGHGGLLDRCDSLLLTAPVLYYALFWGHAALLMM